MSTNSNTMKVICAGAPKTGTKSTAKALRMLGYDQVFDVEECMEFAFIEWEDFFDKRVPDMQKIFDAYEAHHVEAVVDMPHSYFFDRFLERWPHAKVVLMIRDEDSWFDSFVNMITEAGKNHPYVGLLKPLSSSMRRFIRFTETLANVTFGSWKPHPFLWKTWYRRHNAYVKSTVPKGQLLEMDVREGWGPLCKFLGKPVPDEEFPAENRATSKSKIVDRLMKDTWLLKQAEKEIRFSITLIVLAVGIAVGLYFFM